MAMTMGGGGGGGAGSNQSYTAIVAQSGTASTGYYVCDGANDQVQIQAAIDYATTKGGGVVLIKAGTYDIQATIAMNNDSNVQLVGEGVGTILNGNFNVSSHKHITGGELDCCVLLLGSDGDTDSYFHADHVKHVRVADLKIDCNGSIGNHIEGIRCSHLDYSVIERVYVVDSGDSCVVIDDYCAEVTVRNCIITGSGQSDDSVSIPSNGIGCGGTRYIKILDNFVYDCGHDNTNGNGNKGSGIEIDGGTNDPPVNHYYIIRGNHFYSNHDTGIYLYGLADSIIEGNYCYYNYNHGINLEDGDSHNHHNDDLRIIGNALYGNQNGAGILAENADHIWVDDNDIYDNGTYGIDFGATACNDWFIGTGNKIEGNSSGNVEVASGTLIWSHMEVINFCTTTSMDTGNVHYHLLRGGAAGSTTRASKAILMAKRGFIKNLYFKTSQAPDNGAGAQSFTVALEDDGVNTALTCAISEAATDANDLVNSPEFAAGSLLNWEITPANTPAGSTYGYIYAELYILDW